MVQPTFIRMKEYGILVDAVMFAEVSEFPVAIVMVMVTYLVSVIAVGFLVVTVVEIFVAEAVMAEGSLIARLVSEAQ